MPEQWGRPTWMVDETPEPSLTPWLFWITMSVIIGASVGYFAWRLFR